MNKQRTIENPLIGDRVTFVRTAAETGGARTVVEVSLIAGGGNDLHYHEAFDETFTVKRGQLSIEVEDEVIRLLPGESATAPAGALHRFFNETARPVLFEVELNPGHEGFEKSLCIAYGLARDGRCFRNGIPRRLSHLALILELSGTFLPGAFSRMEPLIRLLAGRARRRGIEQKLIEKYCHPCGIGLRESSELYTNRSRTTSVKLG